MRIRLVILWMLCILGGLSHTKAQIPPKNNDCLNVFLAGKLICGNAAFTQDNLNGPGINDFGPQFNNYSGCIQTSGPTGGPPESMSAWYAIKIQAGGTLTMDILPIVGVNYDFAIFGPNKPCHALGSPVRCSYANPRHPNWYKTGMNLSAGATSEDSGGFGYVRYMDVLPGELYYIFINSYNNFNGGFEIKWGGTAKLANSTSEFSSTVSCNAANFTNQSVACDGQLGYLWDFGDDAPITSIHREKSPSYRYSAVGTYNVTLTTTILSSSSPTNVGLTAVSSRQVVISKVPPLASLPQLQSAYCLTDAPVPLVATPTGGSFSIRKGQVGLFLPATEFAPAALGVGKHEVRYVYEDPSDLACRSVRYLVVEVFPTLPTPTIDALLPAYCRDTPPFALMGTPAGGVFRVNGMPSATFAPAQLGGGRHTVVYEFTAGCKVSTSAEVLVLPLPSLNLEGLADAYCQQSFAVPLKANPTGGAFTVNGLPATELNPRDYAAGDVLLVRYDYADAQSCSDFVEKQVEITPASVFAPVAEALDICPQPTYWLEALTPAEEQAYTSAGITPVYFWAHTQASVRRVSITEPSQSGSYEVMIRDHAGCPIAQKSYTVKVDCEPKLFIPTAFTPNADGKNEKLQIFGEDFIKLDFKVFNRWGEVVYTARSREEMWDGTVKGKPAPAGIYVWTATFENTLKRGEVVRRQGQFSLIR